MIWRPNLPRTITPRSWCACRGWRSVTSVPCRSRASALLRCRLSYALYRQMGTTDLSVDSPAEYVQLAVRLGTDTNYRAEVRQRIADRCGVLFTDIQAVRELEQFLHLAAGR